MLRGYGCSYFATGRSTSKVDQISLGRRAFELGAKTQSILDAANLGTSRLIQPSFGPMSAFSYLGAWLSHNLDIAHDVHAKYKSTRAEIELYREGRT